MSGSLIVVGTGIRTVGHMTLEAVAWIKQADKVLYVVGDPIAEAMIKEMNPKGAESLSSFYAVGKSRIDTYNEMIEHILGCVRSGLNTCLACYGHPGVFVYPSHQSIQRARAEGYPARMLPGISAEDCLFADLGVDPGMLGCQSYEATDFLVNGRVIDPSGSVVLWQIGVVGDSTFKTNGYDLSALPLLIERLGQYYPPHHPIYLYEAATLPGCDPIIIPATIGTLGSVPLTAGFTAYLPPGRPTTPDPVLHQRMMALQAH
ncbi:MAG TPA: SAM-dependent methyltransferase [Allosphingosinicella sp.]|nr:SAM-dependent methyltransferase [Allosphingosinicella sp.]